LQWFHFQILVHLLVQKHRVREAVAYLHEHHPDLIIGEVQADFALNPEMLKENFLFKISRKKSKYLNFFLTLIWLISPINY
jgi:hypothetical protein